MMNADTGNSNTIETSNDTNAENNSGAIEQNPASSILNTSSELSLIDNASPLICSSSSSMSVTHLRCSDTEVLLYQAFLVWAELKLIRWQRGPKYSPTPYLDYLLHKKTLQARNIITSTLMDIYDSRKTFTPLVLINEILSFIESSFYWIDSSYLQDKRLISFGLANDLIFIKSLREIKNDTLRDGPMTLESLTVAISNQIAVDILDNDILLRALLLSDLSDDLMAYIIMHGMKNKSTLNTRANTFMFARLSGIATALRHQSNTYHTADLGIFPVTENRQPGITFLAEALTHTNCRLTQLSLQWPSEAIDHPIVTPIMQAISDPRCQLQRLHLETSELTDADITAISPTLKQGKLTHLHLNIYTLRAGQLATLTIAIHNLHCFQLSTEQLTQMDIAAIASMLITNSPTKLYLRTQTLVDASIAPIAQATMTKACGLKVFKYFISGTLTTSEMTHIARALVAPSSHTQWGLYQYPATADEENWRLLLQAIADFHCHLTWLNLKSSERDHEHNIIELANALEGNHSLVMLNNLFSSPFADLNSPNIKGINRLIALCEKTAKSILHKKSEMITYNCLYKSLTLQQLAYLAATQTNQDLSLLLPYLPIQFTKWQTKAMKTLGLFSFNQSHTPSCSSMNNTLRLDIEKPGPC